MSLTYLKSLLENGYQFRIDHISVLPGIIGENQFSGWLQNPFP
jgi:hypothetical protein